MLSIRYPADMHCRNFVLKAVQHLPWECVPSLTQSSISRMPSLYHLHAQLSYLTKQKSSILHTGIDKQRVFYVLNPDSNLASTQETFQDWFSRYPSTQAIHASVFVRLKMLMNLIKVVFEGSMWRKVWHIYRNKRCESETGGIYFVDLKI